LRSSAQVAQSASNSRAALQYGISPCPCGKSLSFRGLTVKVEELDEYIVRGVDLALFSTADSSISKRYAPIAARSGAGR
jgi:aspartate-semialdehyde dehydrogenase